jgi:hypothetical protein
MGRSSAVSIEAALVDYGTASAGWTGVSAEIAKQLAKLSNFIDIPHIGFSGDVSGRKSRCL